MPKADGQRIPVWVRNGWSDSESTVVTDAREAGTDSPLIFTRGTGGVLKTSERIAISGLFDGAGVKNVKPNDVGHHVRAFLGTVREMAQRAGGPAPLPAPPSTALLDEIASLTGNRQLLQIYESRNALNRDMSAWGTLANRITQRKPEWDRLKQALGYAGSRPEVDDVRRQVEAIEEQRSLLADTDPMEGLLARVIDALRRALVAVHGTYRETYDRERAALEAEAVWQALDTPAREALLARYGVDDVPAIDVGTPEAVLHSLEHRSLEMWRAQYDALHDRFRQVLTEAARQSEPKARHVRLPSATLRDADDVERWIDETREKLLAEVSEGPIIARR